VAVATGGVALSGIGVTWYNRRRQPPAGVTILKAKSYGDNLSDLIRRGLQNHPQVLQRVKGGRVVLKPNMVEYYEAHRVNTNPLVVAAAIDAFRAAGAREVIVAEGPGHRRDTEALLEQTGLDEVTVQEKTPFVDLNHDSIHPISLPANYTKLGRLFLPDTIMGADVVVSMPKLKTHHWAGFTLSLKNMFGVVPGVKYGWPKNLLHWRGIHESIVDINLAVRPGFAIIDGIEGMDGDGPLFGDTVNAGVLIMGDNLAAVDATGARVMGLYPEHVPYIQMIAHHGGTVHESRIQQCGENIAEVRQDFKVLDHFAVLKQPPSLITSIKGV
jgi:uncharacterized protein (DUF362 family)